MLLHWCCPLKIISTIFCRKLRILPIFELLKILKLFESLGHPPYSIYKKLKKLNLKGQGQASCSNFAQDYSLCYSTKVKGRKNERTSFRFELKTHSVKKLRSFSLLYSILILKGERKYGTKICIHSLYICSWSSSTHFIENLYTFF